MLFLFKILIINVLLKQSEALKCDPLLLTPYIESHNLVEARRLSAVHLESDLNIESYSGFLTVNKEFNSNLFFWFFPSQNNKATAPVILWLQGGPGSSSMMALFEENGPFTVDNGLLVRNNYSWAQDFSVIYIDNPVGTGFSFTEDKKGFVTNQTAVGLDLYEALKQFFTIFSEYRSNEFYVTGESYAGKYVPAIGYRLHQMFKESNINFRGIAIGNGWIDPLNMLDIGSFLYAIGLIDELELNYFFEIQNKTAIAIKNQNFREAFALQDQLIGGDLTTRSTYFTNVTGYTYYLNFLHSDPSAESHDWVNFLNDNITQKALHVPCRQYSDYNFTVEDYLTEDQYDSVKPWIETLMENYKVLIYNGNLDIIVALPLTNNFLKNLDWKYSKQLSEAKRDVWRSPEGDILGYVRQVANFTQVVVRNAGHLVPLDQPMAALEMITKFIKSKPFSKP